MKKNNSTYPWGTAQVLAEGENYRVKRIFLKNMFAHMKIYQIHIILSVEK